MARTTGIPFVLKTASVKPSKASLDSMDIMKLPGGIREEVLVKDYALHKKWINESMIAYRLGMNNNTKILKLLGAHKKCCLW